MTETQLEGFRIPSDVMSKIKKVAERDNTTKSEVVIRALKQFILEEDEGLAIIASKMKTIEELVGELKGVGVILRSVGKITHASKRQVRDKKEGGNESTPLPPQGHDSMRSLGCE